MKHEIGITISDALRLESLKNAKVVAGESGQYRVIKSVNIMEVPDIIQWVKEGELLLTTVYAIKDDEDAQRRLIPVLAERGLAGLAIKPGRYIEKIPPIMVEQANQFKFPLIELPMESSFSDLMDPILSEIFNAQAVFLKKSLDTHEMLMEVVLHGGGLIEITSALAQMLQSPVAILNTNNEVQAQEFLEQISPDDILERDKLAKVWRLKTSLAQSYREIGRFKETHIKLDDRSIRQIFIPILVNQETLGYIYVWEVDQALKEFDLMSIERAITVAAMEILNQQAVFEVERRYRNDLLHDLLNGRFESEDVINSRAKSMQWNLNTSFSVLVFELVNQSIAKNGSRQEQLVWNQIIRGVKQTIENINEQVILGEWGAKLVLLHSIPEHLSDQGSKEISEYLEKTISEVKRVFEQCQQQCYIGVGALCTGISSIRQSYHEAKEATRVGKVMANPEKSFYYEKLGIYRLLHKVPGKDLQNFLKDTLGPLIKYDEDHNSELVKTLNLYFENNGNLRSLAKELFVHYNTILYRIERIQNILNIDLANRDIRISLEVALKIYFS